ALSPVENEAVVSAVLSAFPGKIELVDAGQELPQLRRAKGLVKWAVLDVDGSEYASHSEVPPSRRQKISASCFPPEGAHTLNMERCMRVYPHLQNTGGFFVAVLRKTDEDGGARDRAPNPEAPPTAFFPLLNDTLAEFCTLFGIDREELAKISLVREKEKGQNRKTISAVSEAVAAVLAADNRNLRIKNCGVKVMTQQKNETGVFAYKLASSSIDILGKHITERTVEVDENTLRTLLLRELHFPDLPDAVAEQTEKTSVGTVLVFCPAMDRRFYGWRGHKTLSLCVDKSYRQRLSL
ncbi:MAG: tRNA m(5)C methyltransferase NCL1, partial [Amphiamblys sp. WSBS2006]